MVMQKGSKGVCRGFLSHAAAKQDLSGTFEEPLRGPQLEDGCDGRPLGVREDHGYKPGQKSKDVRYFAQKYAQAVAFKICFRLLLWRRYAKEINLSSESNCVLFACSFGSSSIGHLLYIS